MAEKKTEQYLQDTSTKTVIDLLTSILDEFKKQVQSRTPSPLGEKALNAIGAFKEISAALDVKPAGSSFQPQSRIVE